MATETLNINTFIDVTQTGHGFVAGDVLYRTSGGAYALADATAEVSSQVVGMVAEGSGNDFKLALSGHKINGLSGFTDGSTYYLSETTTGGLTDTPPSAPNYVVPVCIAVSTTSVVVGNLGANIRVRGLNAEFFDTDPIEPLFARIYRSGGGNGRFSIVNGDHLEMVMEGGDGYIMFPNTDVVIANDTDYGNPNLNISPSGGSNPMAFTLNGYEGIVFSIDKHGVITAANLSGTNTGDETAQRIGNLINGATAKTTPVDADMVGLMDSAAGNILKKLSWLNVKATLKTYFDTLYQTIITFGTGVQTALGVNVGSAGSVVVNGGALGTPSSGTATNLSGTATALNIGGNAATATALQTSRNIDGQAFNGTADITVIAPGTHAATSKTTPVDADELPLVDSAASNVLKKLTWANLKATLKTYFDTLYQALNANLTAIAGLTTSADHVTQWTGSGTAQLVDLKLGTEATYGDTPAWVGGAGPTGASTLKMYYTQIGNLVNFQIMMTYATGGTATGVTLPFPSAFPTPDIPAGFTGASVKLNMGLLGRFIATPTGTPAGTTSSLVRNAADNGFEFINTGAASASYRVFMLSGSYFTA